MDCAVSMNYGSLGRPSIWIGFVSRVLQLALWQYRPDECLEMGWYVALRSSEEIHHVGMGTASRKYYIYYIYNSNGTA